MSGMRKWLCLLLGVAFAAFALPAAAQKVYTLNMTPKAPASLSPGGIGQIVTASFNNISSDTGNSSVKSIKLFAPTGITITAPANGSVVNIGNGYTATVQNNGTSIFLSNIQLPLKPFGPTLTLTMTVNVTCTATGTGWTTVQNGKDQVWNGASFTGQNFSFVNTPQNPSSVNTPVTGVCGTISFVNQPATTFTNVAITTTPHNNPAGLPVTVMLTINNSPAPDGTMVTVSVTAGACSIAAANAATSGGIATFSNLVSSTPGTSCQLKATGGGVNPPALSATFDIDGPDGTLSCDPNAPNNHAGNLDPNQIPPLGTFDWGLKRGENTDGSCGPDVPFTFDLDETTRTVIFTEDSLGQGTSVEYIIRWPLVDVDNDQWSAKQPCITYGVSNPQYAEDANGVCFGDYVPAVACLADDVNGPGDGTPVMPVFPNIYPYLGGEPQYQPGTNAKVCVAQQGWTSSSGKVQYWTKIIDQSDAGIRLP